jgi:hypothetical protein
MATFACQFGRFNLLPIQIIGQFLLSGMLTLATSALSNADKVVDIGKPLH